MKIDLINTSYLKSLIDAAVKRKIQHLDVRCSPDTAYKMPLSLYSCEALVSLKLFAVEVTLDDLKFVSLPCVKTMHLKYIHYGNKATYEATFERLVSCCPVLEELKIFAYAWYSETVYRVLSRSLKKLRIKIAVDYKDCVSRFVIDTPRLSFLSIKNNLSESFIINNMESNAKVEISLPFGFDYFDEASVSSRRSSIRRFLYGISKVRDMTICRDTFKLICQYSKLEPLPQFGCMSRLRVTLDVSDFQLLPTFLESCANLKSLILVWNGDSNKMPFDGRLNPRIRFYPVPECLLSSLEFVDLKTSISGYTPEIKLVRYFLENSTLLKKVALRLNYYCTNEKLIVKELLEIPRRSVTCQVVIY